MSFFKSILTVAILASADLVAGHGAIIKAVGDAGGEGMALGINSDTPRDGTRRNPFQTDSTRFRGAQANSFGETLASGNNNLEVGTKAIMSETGDQLPQISQGGQLEMTLHQVNADGGGPYTCEINSDGTGQRFTSLDVPTTVPGRNSRNRSGASTDFPLIASIPNNQECTGVVAGQENVRLVRCMNAARAGPFGGVVPVQIAGTANKEKSRRALANSIKRDLESLQSLKRRSTFTEEFEIPEDDPEYLAELRADGEDI